MLAHSPAVARLTATTPLDTLASLRIVEHGVAVLVGGGVPLQEAVLAIQAVGQLTSGAVFLEAFWREWAASGGQIYLSPPSLPQPELPTLSAAAEAGAFRSPEDVFEFGLQAHRRASGAAIRLATSMSSGPIGRPPPGR